MSISGLFLTLKSLIERDLILPILLLFAYTIFLIIARGAVPTADELISTFSNLYANYGYQIIFLGAFFESLVLVNFFVPGTIAMAMGAIFAGTGEVELTFVILTASFGAICGYSLDYVVGYFGFGDIFIKAGYQGLLERTKSQIIKLGVKGLIVSFIYPTTGSVVSVVAGIIRMNQFRFLSIMMVSVTFWFTMWGILFYSIGEKLLQIFTRYSFLVVLLAVGGIFLVRAWNKADEKR